MHPKEGPGLRTELVTFPQGAQARIVVAPATTAAASIVKVLQIEPPRAVVVLNGGTAIPNDEQRHRIGRLLQDGLARFVADEQVIIVTGGGDSGVFRLLGQGFARWRPTAPCIGVAVANLVSWPNHAGGNVTLEPHHSHFVLVDGADWGDETAMMYDLVATLAQQCPSVAIFAGGGEVVKQEMLANLRQRRNMILLGGSGRTTDAVLAARAGTFTTDAAIQQVADAGLIVECDPCVEPDDLHTLLTRILLD